MLRAELQKNGIKVLFNRRGATPERWRAHFVCTKQMYESLTITSLHPTELDKDKLENLIKYIVQVKESRNYEKLKRFKLDARGIEISELDDKKVFGLIKRKLKNLIQYSGLHQGRQCYSYFPFEVYRKCDMMIYSNRMSLNIRPNFYQHIQDLHFSFFRITSEGIKYIGAIIGSKIKFLRSLRLDCNSVYDASDSSIKFFTKQLKKRQRTLQSLTLDFKSASQGINDNFVEILAKNIGSDLKFLKSLTLNFASNSDCTERSARAIATEIGENLKRLQHFSINFYTCGRIQTFELKTLALGIGEKINTLQSLELRNYFSQSMKDELRQKLSRIPSLKLY